MILLNPYVYANRNGIPRLEAYSGLILFKLPGFTAPTTAVPIVFSTNGKDQDLTTLGGAAVTSATLNQAGIYLAYYENNTLQLL